MKKIDTKHFDVNFLMLHLNIIEAGHVYLRAQLKEFKNPMGEGACPTSSGSAFYGLPLIQGRALSEPSISMTNGESPAVLKYCWHTLLNDGRRALDLQITRSSAKLNYTDTSS